MLADRFDLAVTTTSPAARDAFVEGYDLLFALWTGAEAAFARATAEDPAFALAHLGAAQAAILRGDVPAMQAALARANAAPTASRREASHLAFFNLLLTGQSAAALAAARTHLGEWPRDAAVMNHYGPILGLISTSGRPGAKREQELVMDYFAPHYGDDWWYTAHHAMALSEVGRTDDARRLADRSLAANRRNTFAAHSRAHIAYEANEPDGARAFMADWLTECPRDTPAYGHVAWHLAIAELTAGNEAEAFRIYTDAVAPGRHLGVPRLRVYDAIQFLWRWELAGNPRDPARWRSLSAFAHTVMPRAAAHFPDLHIALADAVAGDAAALQSRIEQMEALVSAGRYPEGKIIPDAARGLAAFARGDYAQAISTLSPLLDEVERLGGSRAQTDMVEFTVLRACVEAGRLDELQRLLATRRPAPRRVPVAGVH